MKQPFYIQQAVDILVLHIVCCVHWFSFVRGMKLFQLICLHYHKYLNILSSCLNASELLHRCGCSMHQRVSFFQFFSPFLFFLHLSLCSFIYFAPPPFVNSPLHLLWSRLATSGNVDMQSTAPSNQYFWKVVTNGPQGEESTLNT